MQLVADNIGSENDRQLALLTGHGNHPAHFCTLATAGGGVGFEQLGHLRDQAAQYEPVNSSSMAFLTLSIFHQLSRRRRLWPSSAWLCGAPTAASTFSMVRLPTWTDRNLMTR